MIGQLIENTEEFKEEMKYNNVSKEIFEDNDKLKKALYELDDTIYTEFNTFIDDIIERM